MEPEIGSPNAEYRSDKAKLFTPAPAPKVVYSDTTEGRVMSKLDAAH